MKNSILALSFISLISCNSYNDKMNALLSKQSELEGVIKITDSIIMSYVKKRIDVVDGSTTTKEEMERTAQFAVTPPVRILKKYRSKEYKMYSDSIKKYEFLRLEFKESSKQVNYSIDSLSKLK